MARMTKQDVEAKIETAQKRRLAVEKAKHGYEPGARFLGGQQYEITVTWYPKTKWWAQTATHNGQTWVFGEKVPLTPELWAQLEPLRL